MNENQKKLKKLSKDKKSKWVKDAEFRVRNRKWLTYSNQIAKRILAALEDKEDINQKKLAATIQVSPQYISKVVKGKENLSLETISKISDALKVELIIFPTYKYSNFEHLQRQAIMMAGFLFSNLEVGQRQNRFSIGNEKAIEVSPEQLGVLKNIISSKMPKIVSSQDISILPKTWYEQIPDSKI